MEVHHRELTEPTPEEAKELERLKAIIEGIIADGIITRAEFDRLRSEALNNKASAEQISRELALYRKLVTEKVQQGLIEVERFDS